MSGGERVLRVAMPERGVFAVRLDEGAAAPARGAEVVVALGYGEDVGRAIDVRPYDERVHGPRLPAFRFLRDVGEAERNVLRDNLALAEAMRDAFLRGARAAASDISIPYARLSLDRACLFLRYECEAAQPDFSTVAAELKRLYAVTVNLWRMGPRDRVAMAGAAGACGRVCCCASWQERYPAGLNSATARDQGQSNAVNANGVCGRFKCCLAFEERESD